MDLMKYLQKSQQSLFRFEALQNYAVDEEEKSFSEFLKTGKVEISDNQEWYEFISAKVASGVKMQRVRLVTLPLTTYTRYELPYLEAASDHGDQIYIIMDQDFRKLTIPVQDFWLIDDLHALLMNYDDQGKYQNFQLFENVGPYKVIKNKLLKQAVKLADFLKKIDGYKNEH
jgi:hypothetical protein